MTERIGFYERVLRRLVDEGLVQRDWRVLVVAGGAVDRAAFAACGFTDVTFTNLSGDGDERQDAEALTYDDDVVRLRGHLGGVASLRVAASRAARAVPRRAARRPRARGSRLGA